MNAQIAIEHVLHDLPTAATATFLALFPIVNPLGEVPMFFSLTADYMPEERRLTALKIAVDGVAILSSSCSSAASSSTSSAFLCRC
ncbi:MAG TPA: MarC family protein [Terriglobales bacterium]